MGALRSFRLSSVGVIAMAIAAPAAAKLPGSTQPGAPPIPPGNILLLRDVPARNAIVPGAGVALSVSPAPPDSVFGTIQGVITRLTDAEAAAVAGPIGKTAGQSTAGAVDGVFDSQSMIGGLAPSQSGASAAGSEVRGALQTGLGALSNALGNLHGGGF